MVVSDFAFPAQSFALKAFFCGAIAFILSPRKTIINTQKGKVKQVTWMFLKKPIVLSS